MIKNVISLGEAVVKHEFVYEKNGITTFECCELISREANGRREYLRLQGGFWATRGAREA